MPKQRTRQREKRVRIGIAASRFNEYITRRLLDGCLNELAKKGVAKTDVTVAWVPGSFELPVVALKLAKRKDVDAVICLGAVIKGETIHFELVAQGAAQGIMQVGLMTAKPVIFGVLATDTVNQAQSRAQEKGNNKGRDAAQSALEMIEALKQI